MKSNRIAVAVLAAWIGILPMTSMAEEHWRGDHHDMRHFEGHDARHWASGHWYHGDHDGRLGWWWVVGAAVDTALWYSYARPVYPYPNPYVPPTAAAYVQAPAPVVAAPPAQPSMWYFCASSGKYYPYASSCPEGWRPVPAQPPQ